MAVILFPHNELTEKFNGTSPDHGNENVISMEFSSLAAS